MLDENEILQIRSRWHEQTKQVRPVPIIATYFWTVLCTKESALSGVGSVWPTVFQRPDFDTNST
jgi:hypothetical protein